MADGLSVGNLIITADSDISVQTRAIAVSAGALGGAGSVAKSIVAPTIEAGIGEQANILVANDLIITALSQADADADALGVAIGFGGSA